MMAEPLTSHEKIALSALYERIGQTMKKIENPSSFDAPDWLTDAAGKGLAYHRTYLKRAEKNEDFVELRFHMRMALLSLPDN